MTYGFAWRGVKAPRFLRRRKDSQGLLPSILSIPVRCHTVPCAITTECCVFTRTDLVPSHQLAVPAASPGGLDLVTWPQGYDPVLSLTILRRIGGSEEILVGIRDPRTNVNHPDTVSVPTQRVTHEIAGLLYDPVQPGACDDRVHDGAFMSDTLAALVYGVFTSKLGADDGLLSVREVSARLRRVDFGESLIGVLGNGEPRTERLGMFGVEVNVDARFEVPRDTSSYSLLEWLPLDQFLIMAVTRDATVLPIGLKAAEVCVQGLCMHSAVEIVRSRRTAAPAAHDTAIALQ
jgi:hypothetical protein